MPASQVAQPQERHGKGTAIALAGVVILLILAIVGVMGYPTYIAPFRRTIITVDNINIRMDYFLKRIKLSGSDPLGMLTQITNEQIIKLGAPRYVSIGPGDIDETMRSIYQGRSDNASGSFSEGEFKEWYRQILNETGLSDAEYRDIISVEILRSRLQEYLAVRMPTVAEQIHLYAIAVETLKQAERAQARWHAGEKFADLAKELSFDRTTAEKGGEIGWFPQAGILPPNLEYEAFNLTTGNISEPIPIISEQSTPEGGSAPTVVGYQLLLVTERGDRELDENALRVMRSQVVDKWLTAERGNYTIRWYGLKGNFDSETYAWINYQVAKSKSGGASKTASGSR